MVDYLCLEIDLFWLSHGFYFINKNRSGLLIYIWFVGMVDYLCLEIDLFWLSHHHFTKLVKVHRAGSVFIKLLKNSLQFFLCKGSKKFSDEASQSFGGDVSKTLLIVDSESILKFPLHGLHVRIFNKEGCTQLCELSKLNLSGAILINLLEKIFEFFLSRSEA